MRLGKARALGRLWLSSLRKTHAGQRAAVEGRALVYLPEGEAAAIASKATWRAYWREAGREGFRNRSARRHQVVRP